MEMTRNTSDEEAMKVEKVKDGKVTESFSFKNKEDVIAHIFGLMMAYDIDTEDLDI